jgi:hypothetical protein
MARERLTETKKLLAAGRDPAVQAKLAKITRAVTLTAVAVAVTIRG